MAKTKSNPAASKGPLPPQDNTSTVSDRYIYYDKLNFVPVEDKDEVWAAQVLAFIKRNSSYFIDPVHAKKMRNLERGEIDAKEYKKMFDPEMELTGGKKVGGEAKYTHADWKSCPIFAHLDNILEAQIRQIPLNIQVKPADQFVISKLQKVNQQIIGREQMTDFINYFNKKLVLPTLSKFDDPFRYAKSLKNGTANTTQKKNFKLRPNLVKQPPTSLLDSIKASINDNESLALFNEFIYKCEEATACEMGIKYYMIQENKYLNKARSIVSDLKNFNATLMRFYTSQTTGRPKCEYMDGAKVFTLPFEMDDLSDLKGWYTEYDVTFGDFIQMFGANRTDTELKQIFEIHRKYNNFKPDTTYEGCGYWTRKNAKIRIGYVEFETQDMEVYSKYEYLGNPKFKREKSDFKPNLDKFPGTERVEKHYDVWYKFYYMPLLLDSSTPNYNLEQQAKYIYDFGKLQDQQREGDDYRYSKSSLFGFRNRKKLTWAEILNRFMPKINFLWFRFQNEMVNAIPNGGLFAKKLVTMMAQAADTAGNNNEAAGIEFMRQFRQTGFGMGDPLVDDTGKVIGTGSPFMEFKNGMMAAAFEHLNGMMQLYNLLMTSLSQNSITEGAGSKPRQNATGIQYTVDAGKQAIYFLIDPYQDLTLDCATKFVYYFKDIVDDGPSERLEDFVSVVGEGVADAWETVKDIPFHNLGLSVINQISDDQKKLITGLCESLASAGVLMPEDVFFISNIDNVDYAYAILSLKAKEGRKVMAQLAVQQQQLQNEGKKLDVQLKILQIREQGKVTADNINLAKQWDMKIDEMMNNIKGHFQTQIKQLTGQNKAEEMITQSNIDKLNNSDTITTNPAEKLAV